ncbi:MAG: hypothetical protein JNM62_08590 [Flavobacteriales bacterium]|nr:hypothetical protein [Flavobacteriales bacterium]
MHTAMKTAFTVVLLLWSTLLLSQTNGKVLILSNVAGQVLVDGQAIGDAEPNKPLIHEVSVGDHLVQLAWSNNGKAEVKNEMVAVEAGKQKAVSFTVEASAAMALGASAVAPERILVADQNVLVSGILVNSINGVVKPSEFMYGFEAGDEVVLDITMSNLKGTNSLKVTTYPGGVVLFSNLAFSALTDQRFKIQERGILKFSLTTNHMIDRNAYVKVWRIPASPATAVFNTNVVRKKINTTHQVAEKQEFFVNSGSNATFSGGKSRVSLPVSLPPNTIEWYYRFSASREMADIERVQQTTGLFAELGSMLFSGGSSALLGQGAQGLLSSLSQPPGANVCDIILLDHDNMALFEAKAEYKYIPAATRQNFKSGNVRVDCCPTGQWYLGIRNPDSMHGIHVFMDMVAITQVEDWVMEGGN